jgi:hypothetical protein
MNEGKLCTTCGGVASLGRTGGAAERKKAPWLPTHSLAPLSPGLRRLESRRGALSWTMMRSGGDMVKRIN